VNTGANDPCGAPHSEAEKLAPLFTCAPMRFHPVVAVA
jgi:hypothetical protein